MHYTVVKNTLAREEPGCRRMLSLRRVAQDSSSRAQALAPLAPQTARMIEQQTDPFFEPYDRDEIAYGEQPSAALAEYLRQVRPRGRALDLGAGAGRDSIALAQAGLQVTAVDLSQRGLQRVAQRAERFGLGDQIVTRAADVRELELTPASFDAIVATTVLDHIPYADAVELWNRITAALTDQGFLYVQVHTTEDPGSDRLPGCESQSPISETADAVINYFAPNQLVRWATQPESGLRVLRYEERLEWDYTHGSEHQHGKAILLAVHAGWYPEWYGQPPAFPRQV